jgi:hypothetical protein
VNLAIALAELVGVVVFIVLACVAYGWFKDGGKSN